MSWHTLTLLTILLIACRPGAEKPDSGDTQATVVTVIPTVRVVSPEDGATLTASDVEIILDLTDFRLEPPAADTGGARLSPLPLLPFLAIPSARAHGDLSDPSGYVRITIDGEHGGLATESIFTIADLSDGEHTVGFELFWAEDNDAFYPPVETEVSFTVSAAPPG